MAKKIIMPKLDMTMEEGEISTWFVKEGDTVKKGDAIFEVLSEKAAIEVESTAKGIILKIIHQEGEVVKVTETVAIVGKSGEDYADLLEDKIIEVKMVSDEIAVSETTQAVSRSTGKVPATPAAKSIAIENNIDLSEVPMNAQGVIRKQQVENHIADLQSNKTKSTALAKKLAEEYDVNLSDVSCEGSRIYSDDVLSLVNQEAPVATKLQGIHKMSANKLTKVWQNVPMVTLTVEVDVSELITLCERVNAKINEDGVRINMTDVFIKIMGLALVDNPKANVSLQEDMLIQHNDVNISVAVATEEGLTVPVIKDVNHKGLIEINREKRLLAGKAKNGTLTKDDFKGGRMTISNIGMLGVDVFTPILNAPESHIIGIGRVKEKPVVVKGEITIRPMMWISHTFDHRALDGVPAMKVLASIRDMIEEPYSIIL